MKEKFSSKFCCICGDKASGYNFNAITCESCKAFFRRNASKYEGLKCHFEDNCNVDIVSRKFCKKCRLRKCFDANMRKEWILNEEQKHRRKSKIEENRKKRRLSQTDCIKDFDLTLNSSQESTQSFAKENNSNKHLITIFGNKFEDIIKCEEISDILCKYSNNSSIISISRPITVLNNEFNSLEVNRLSALLSATHSLWTQTVPVTSEAMNMDDVCKLWGFKFEQEIKKIVKMSKTLYEFKSLCENDQIALVKYGCIEIFIMRLVMNFNFESEYWTLVTDNNNSTLLKLELLKESKQNLYDIYKSYLQKVRPEWDSDLIVLDLLTAIVLYNPNRPNLIHKELIKLQQNIYIYLLQRYLTLRHRSKSKFQSLMNSLQDLHLLNKVHLKGYSKKDPNKISPLLREVMDLNKEMIGEKPSNHNLLIEL